MPPRPVDHKARFDGWNYDERWVGPEVHWKGDRFEAFDGPTAPAKGERPIVAVYGGPGEAVAVQFVENDKRIVGNSYPEHLHFRYKFRCQRDDRWSGPHSSRD